MVGAGARAGARAGGVFAVALFEYKFADTYVWSIVIAVLLQLQYSKIL